MPKEIRVKSILNKTKRRDPWFLDDYTVNMYSGCSFNCLYCYIRGSKYGINLETSLSVKINGLELLEKQLASRAKKQQYGIIVLSSVTDPYLQIEKQYQLTREALKIIAQHRFPVHIITKSDLVVRDFDLLQQIDQTAILPDDLQTQVNRGAIISFSFSSLADEVAKIFEPGATRPSARLKALQKSINHGFLTGVNLMPLLPFISDTTKQLDLMFKTFKAMQIKYIFPATITLYGDGPADSKTLVTQAIRKHYPELEKKYLGYFQKGSQMPDFYQRAFVKKMQAMCDEFQIPNSLLKPSP